VTGSGVTAPKVSGVLAGKQRDNRGLCLRYRFHRRRGSVASRNSHPDRHAASIGGLNASRPEEVEGGAHAEHHARQLGAMAIIQRSCLGIPG